MTTPSDVFPAAFGVLRSFEDLERHAACERFATLGENRAHPDASRRGWVDCGDPQCGQFDTR